MPTIARRIWLVRHGYRQDYLDPRWPQYALSPLDPPLSAQGFRQAQDLIHAFANIRPDHVLVSPYLRTLQTVQPLANTYDLSIKVEAGIGEIHRAIASPLSLTPAQRAQLIPQMDQHYRSCHSPNAVETDEMAMRRAAHTLGQLLRHLPGNLLLITHESPIQGMVKSLIPTSRKIRCAFCGVTELQLHSEGWTLMRNGDVTHLSTPTTRTRFLYDYVRRQVARRFE